MKKLMKGLALLLLSFGTVASAQESEPRGELLDRIVAVVNENVIMQSELEAEAASLREMVLARGTPLPPDDVFKQQVLDRMINTELQLQFAQRAGITVSDDRINQAMTEIAQRNNTTLSELPRTMAQEGVNYADFREQVRKEMIASEVQRRIIGDRISVSPREVEEYVEREKKSGGRGEYLVSHILLAVPGEAPPEDIEAARARAADIREKILNGASFAEMAATYSQGQQALEGGSLGWRKLTALPTLFADIVAGMQKGEVSEPIRSGSGWHLVQLSDTRGGPERVVATETHARHILLKPNALRDEAATLKFAEKLAARLRNGEDFEKLARENSEDPGSAAQGGDLGWQPPGVFVPRFQEMLDSLEPMTISEPFKSQFGIHVAQVLERRETDFTANVEKNRAYQAIKMRKSEEQFPQWLQKQRDEAHIDIRLEQ